MEQEQHDGKEKATQIAPNKEYIFEYNPITVALIALLFVADLSHDLLVFCLDVWVVGRETPEFDYVCQTLLGLAMVD